MASIIQQRALARMQDNGIDKAKKLANYALKKAGNVDSKGNPTARAYAEAISYLEPYQFDESNAGIAAKTLIAGYTNSATKLALKESGKKKTVEQIKLDEKKSYYASATGGEAAFLATNDLPGLVSLTRETLNQRLFDIGEAISTAEDSDTDTAPLYNQLSETHRRYEDITRLEDDILNGDNSSLHEFGLFIDGDKNGVDGAFIAKVNDLPPNIDKGRYEVLNETASIRGIEGGGLPVYGEYFFDPVDKRKKVILGSREWSSPSGVTGALSYNSKSDPSYVSKAKNASFSISDIPLKNNPINSPGNYFSGITGQNEDGSYKKTLFKVSDDGKQIYSIGDEILKTLKQDAMEGGKIKNALSRNEIDSTYIRDFVVPNAQPYKIEPIIPQLQQQAPTSSSQFSQDSDKLQIQTKTTTPATFFENKNIPNKPESPKGEVGFAERAKGFFRKAF